MVGFDPVGGGGDNFRSFRSLATGWGMFSIAGSRVKSDVLHGRLEINSLLLPFIKNRTVKSVQVGDNPVNYEHCTGALRFDETLKITPGNPLAG